MNISRSGLVDSGDTLRLKEVLRELFQALESSPEYLAFRQIPKEEKTKAKGGVLARSARHSPKERTFHLLSRADRLHALYTIALLS